MKIIKKENKIIIELPFTQEGENTYEEGKWRVQNLLGIITNKEITISQAIYLDYKDSIQEGEPIIYWCFQPDEKDKKDFIKLCDELGIDVYEHSSCSKCGEVIYGCSTGDGKGGELCWKCDYEKEKVALAKI